MFINFRFLFSKITITEKLHDFLHERVQ